LPFRYRGSRRESAVAQLSSFGSEMTPAPPYLRNTGPVVKAFGYWPSFHDAPVVAFHYDRGGPGAVEFTLHGCEMTAEVDERGFFKLIKHHLVRFAFHGITDADLDRFTSGGNILFGLGFSSPEEFVAGGKFSVDLDSAMGGDLCGSFSARSGEVLGVMPCDGEGRRTEPGASPNGGPGASSRNSGVSEGPPSVS
jgi:hypothetical protein